MIQDFSVTKIERVAFVGKDEYPDRHIFFDPCIRYNELIFHFSGEATVLFDRCVLKTKKNSIRFLPKGIVSRHELFHEPGDCILIDFQSDKPVSPHAFVIHIPNGEYIGQLFQKIFSCWAVKKEGYYLESLSLFYKILAEMRKEHLAPTAHQKIIQPAIDMIHSVFLTNTPTNAQLAAACGISESYFKRLFKGQYSISPRQYIVHLKIDYACRCLQHGQYSVAQVAALCNYTNIAFFSRQFKAHMGITPTQFVKNYKSSK